MHLQDKCGREIDDHMQLEQQFNATYDWVKLLHFSTLLSFQTFLGQKPFCNKKKKKNPQCSSNCPKMGCVNMNHIFTRNFQLVSRPNTNERDSF